MRLREFLQAHSDPARHQERRSRGRGSSVRRAAASFGFAALLLLIVTLVLVTAADAEGTRRSLLTGQFERFDGCVLNPNPLNDGDSFVVRFADERLATFRLYFVDAPEEHLSGKRSTRQARHFRVRPGRLTAVGREATAFSARALAEPFTVFTRWQSNFDERRYLAFVQTSDGKDLAELLVRNGLAIPSGERAPTPYGRGSSSQVRRLRELERLAQRDRVGGWAQP